MHMHLLRYLVVYVAVSATMGLAGEPAASPASTLAGAAESQPAAAGKLHCIVVDEASSSPGKAQIVVHRMGAAGWVPVDGLRPDKTGACDVPFAGGNPGLLMLTVSAPGYQDAEALYLPDPEQVIPWLTITLKGARQVSGTVVAEDQKPVEGSRVTIDLPDKVHKTSTDTQGRFVLKDLMPAKATVRVEVPGVGMGSYKVDLATQEEPIEIVIRPQRRMSLVVVDSDNKPVEGLNIQILSPGKAEVRTDADGRVEIPGVGGNAGRISASLEDKFYCFDEAVMKFEIDEGDEPVEREVFAAHGGRIVGQVVEMDEGGEASGIPAANVWLVEGGRIGKNVTCDEDGQFELNAVPPEGYLVAAGLPGYSVAVSQATVEAGKEVKLRFTLDYGTTLKGTVVEPGGQQAEQAIVRVVAWYPKGQPTSASGESEPVELPWRATRTGEKGEFTLENLPPGRVMIEAAAKNGSYRTVVNVQVPEGKSVMESKITLQTSQSKPPM